MPNNLDELEVTWTDSSASSGWTVFVKSSGGAKELRTKEKRLGIRLSEYGKTARPAGINIACTVCATDANGNISACGKQVSFTVSKYELKDSIMYRLVEPLFNAGQDSKIMRKDNDDAKSTEMFGAKAVCIGCHAYSSTGLAALNVKKGKDRRFVVIRLTETGLSLYDTKKIGEFSFLTWSPDARYLAMVVNTFGVIDIKNDIREPFNLRYQSGDIAIYDFATREIKLLPGASEMDFVEDMPSWSPDGKELLFVKYKAEKDRPVEDMSIFRVPFNNGEGGAPLPVVNASGSGDYNYFPTYSPDGRWISFVKGDGSQGVFARPSSDIYVTPRQGGLPRKLSLNTEGVMDSWHRWSSDSGHLIFASKRGGDVTALYSASVDTGGASARPVLVAGYPDVKVNIPEFVAPHYAGVTHRMLNDIIEKIYDENN